MSNFQLWNFVACLRWFLERLHISQLKATSRVLAPRRDGQLMSLEWLSNLSACAKSKAKKHRVSHPLAQHQRWTFSKSPVAHRQLERNNCMQIALQLWQVYQSANCHDVIRVRCRLCPDSCEPQMTSVVGSWLFWSLDHGGLQHSALISGGCTSHSPATVSQET